MKLIQEDEKAFKDYKKLIADLPKEIELKDIKTKRAAIKSAINSMWLCVEKYSAPLTKRRTIMLSHLTDNERKRMVFNKAFVDKLRADNFSICLTDAASVYTLSPIPLLLKHQDSAISISANKITVHQGYMVIAKDVNINVREIVTDFCRTINYRVLDQKIAMDNRSRKHSQKKVVWEDNEEGQMVPVPDEDEDLTGVNYTKEI